MSHSHLILGCESLIRQNIQLPVDLNLMCSLGKEPSFNMCISLLLTVDSLSLEISHLFFSKENDWGFSHFVPWNVSHHSDPNSCMLNGCLYLAIHAPVGAHLILHLYDFHGWTVNLQQLRKGMRQGVG